jgi:RNA polymerase sigma-70 factor, ECF subfamily
MKRALAMTRDQDEATLIEACRNGDRLAFQQLYETHKDRVYSIALHFSGNDSSARDISQQVFLKLFTSIGQFRRDAEFTTWLYRIVANMCIDEQRKRKRLVPFNEAVELGRSQTTGGQEEKFVRKQLAATVRQAIAGLSPKLRIVILLKYVEELSYEEIGETLGCSQGTVASRLNRGHKALARKLDHLRGRIDSIALGE